MNFAYSKPLHEKIMDTHTAKSAKTIEQNFVYDTAPTCSFCGGNMLPLRYLADANSNPLMTSSARLYDHGVGKLKACNRCGIVKFYPDKKE